MSAPLMEVVVPTVGRPTLLEALAPLVGRVPVVVADDRPGRPEPLQVPEGVRVVRSGGRGPAAARNAGWRATTASWVAFLDDDVVPSPGWLAALHRDLARCGPDVGGSQGRIVVPLPSSRRPTDWERSTAGLQTAVWATADLAYRRAALEQVGGFDERFPRAYREDADLGLRVTRAGWRIAPGARHVEHPVRPARWTQSLRSQRGNADDVLMRAVHGRGWRTQAHVPPGRRRWHLLTTAALLTAAGARLAGRRRAAAVAGAAWLGLTADLTARRIAPGPRTLHEVAAMTATSAVLPLAATRWWLTGWLRLPALLRAGDPVRQSTGAGPGAGALTPAEPAPLRQSTGAGPGAGALTQRRPAEPASVRQSTGADPGAGALTQRRPAGPAPLRQSTGADPGAGALTQRGPAGARGTARA